MFEPLLDLRLRPFAAIALEGQERQDITADAVRAHIVGNVSLAASAVGAEGNDRFVGEHDFMQERGYRRSDRGPPVGRSQVNHVVGVPVHVDRAQGRILLLLNLLFHLGQHSVVVLRIGRFRLKFPQVRPGFFGNDLGDTPCVARPGVKQD